MLQKTPIEQAAENLIEVVRKEIHADEFGYDDCERMHQAALKLEKALEAMQTDKSAVDVEGLKGDLEKWINENAGYSGFDSHHKTRDMSVKDKVIERLHEQGRLTPQKPDAVEMIEGLDKALSYWKYVVLPSEIYTNPSREKNIDTIYKAAQAYQALCDKQGKMT